MTETAEKKTDLRVVKTKRAIYAALERLLHKKSIDKITVAELSREAMINKGTLYLHYTDIFDLFQQALKLDSVNLLWSFCLTPNACLIALV